MACEEVRDTAGVKKWRLSVWVERLAVTCGAVRVKFGVGR